jgi:hypothetical protein
LSIPFGPSVVLTVSATSFAAMMLLRWAFFPVVRCVPSGKMKIGCTWLLMVKSSSYFLNKTPCRPFIKVMDEIFIGHKINKNLFNTLRHE